MSLISLEHKGGKAFNISIRQHQILADAAPDDGGEDGGPRSADLFVASLGSCVGMIVVTYCKAHDLPYEGMEVDCAFDLADDPIRIASVAIDVTMPADFPESRRKALLRVAEACPIHNTLHQPPEVSVEVVD